MDEAFLTDYRATVQDAAARLLAISDADAGRRPAPGKWCPKEIIGHLIDSAANNHARFVRAQLPPDPQYSQYDQEGWVRVQHYADRPWRSIVELWRIYNEQLAWVMETADAELLGREFVAPDIPETLSTSMGDGRTPTLQYVMTDYVEHLKHHLRQVLG